MSRKPLPRRLERRHLPLTIHRRTWAQAMTLIVCAALLLLPAVMLKVTMEVESDPFMVLIVALLSAIFLLATVIGIDRSIPPPPPSAVRCPLLTARVIAGIRGTVFVRDAAPTLANLLTLWDGSTPSGVWEIWMPIRPGQIEPQMQATESETDE